MTRPRRAADAARYVLGDPSLTEAPLWRPGGLQSPDHNRYYGVSFDVPLFLAERLLGLDRAAPVSR